MFDRPRCRCLLLAVRGIRLFFIAVALRRCNGIAWESGRGRCENRDVDVPSDIAFRRSPRSRRRLLESKRRLATAESCTGGCRETCTEYCRQLGLGRLRLRLLSNAAKVRDLGVAEKLIESAGAVSDEVVRAMAEGALERTGASVALAVSGIAGPSGGKAGEPVGNCGRAGIRQEDRLECQGHRFN